MSMQVAGHILISGSAGGIGQAVAQEAAAYPDTRLTLWDLPQVDVTDPSQVESAYQEAIAHNGPVDHLIHCAGVLRQDSALHPDRNALEHSMRVNLGGVVSVCSRVAQDMVSRHQGSIVVISSNAGAVPRANMAAYAASKAAATSWARTLGLECAPHGVRLNIVSPGSTNTPMLQSMPNHSVQGCIDGSPENFKLGIPLNRVADPADIARSCLWLCSDAARHITMHDLRVDGGATLDA